MIMFRKILVTGFYLFLLLLWTGIWYYDDLAEHPGKTPDLYWFIPAAVILIQLFLQRFVLWILVWIFFDLIFFLPLIAPLFRLITEQVFIYQSVSGYLAGAGMFAVFNLAFYLVNPERGRNKLRTYTSVAMKKPDVTTNT
jgi:hypothetical protein